MGNNAAVCYSITLYRILEGRALERLTRRKDVLKKMQKSAVLPGKLNIARTFQVVSLLKNPKIDGLVPSSPRFETSQLRFWSFGVGLLLSPRRWKNSLFYFKTFARALESIRPSLAFPSPPPPTKRIKPLEGKLQKVSKIHFPAFALEWLQQYKSERKIPNLTELWKQVEYFLFWSKLRRF